jgi:hypothetical protein
LLRWSTERPYNHDEFDVLGGERVLGTHFFLEPEEHVDQVLVFSPDGGFSLAVLLDDGVHDLEHRVAAALNPAGLAADEHREARGREQVRQAQPGHHAEHVLEQLQARVAALERAAADDGAHGGVRDVRRYDLRQVHRTRR